MKKLILIVCFLGFLSNSFAQTNVFPSFSDSAKWNVLLCVYGIGYGCNTLTYQYEKDTLFCGHVYSKIKLNSSQTNAYIRANSSRAYCRMSNLCSNKEYLIYDYSVNVGDTLYTGFNLGQQPSMDTIPFVVNTIDTENFNGINRRVFHLNYYPEPILLPESYRAMDWIEGIGSTTNPFYFLDCLEDYCERSWGLLCYDSIGVNLYKDSIFNTCDTSYTDAGIREFGNVKKINISPNPFSTSTQITFDKTYQTLDLSIIDLQGKIIQQKSYHDCNKITLDRAGIATGFYFLRVSLDGKFVETKKVVVAD